MSLFAVRECSFPVCALKCFRILFLVLCAGFSSLGLAQPLPPDVRLVIDVSGSMKRNDPNNLRQPAVELLVQLLPENSKAGVWTFGKWVNMLVPHKEVSLEWREAAQAKSADINSVGLFTNIGEALEKAAYDSEGSDGKYRKSIILLTDGMVDVDKDPEANRKEWRRIVDEVLPKLKEAGFTIHTVALSKNADTNLLGKLSLSTDGIAETASSADELMKIFLKAFDVAAPAEKVPLQDNRFVIDSSIEEFTALIFRNNPQETTELIGPDDMVSQTGRLQDGVKWYSTQEYDLITVSQPLEGEWTIKADMAPESRVTVVSNLNLRVKPIPNNVFRGQSLDISFALFEDGKIIKDVDFLELMDVDVSMSAGVNENDMRAIWSESLSRKAPPASGNYQTRLPDFDRNGLYELRIVLDGKTFLREFRHRMTVRQPFAAEFKEEFNAGKVEYVLSVKSFGNDVEVLKTEVLASVTTPQGNRKFIPLGLTDMDSWRGIFEPETEGLYVAEVRIQGEDKAGEKFDVLLEDLSIQYSLEGGLNESPASFFPEEKKVEQQEPSQDAPAEKKSEVDKSQEKKPEPLEKAVEDSAMEEDAVAAEGLPRWVIYAILGAGNLVLLALGFLVYKKLTRSESDDDILEEFSEEKVAEAVKERPTEAEAPTEEDPEEVEELDTLEDEPPMEDLESAMEDIVNADDDEPAMDDIDSDPPTLEEPIEESGLDDLDEMSADETEAADEDDELVNEMLKAQGLDLAGDELDDAISSLIDDLESDDESQKK